MIEVDLNHGNSERKGSICCRFGHTSSIARLQTIITCYLYHSIKMMAYIMSITQQGMHFFLDILQIIFSGNVNAITNFTFS